ncbi:hypothetical protein NQ317_001220 [Molorchus minor]|uniref:CCHC-type domain-containing protein n=1 Tax=Molorchus minor TaxID=1323400 RepID=A0ABQ9JRS9_9CUCU|nr:hypothetical protein NQ317_001220 [Molorchus minor]
MQMSNDQFQQLLKTITDTRAEPSSTPITSGSFSKCRARSNGQRCHMTVDAFITTINIYKDIEKINDEDAIKGLPLLLTDTASTWWQGVKSEATTWNEATALIRAAFSPSKPPHQVYIDIFSQRQEHNMPIDDFVLPERIFGLLHIDIRKEISRDNVQTFSDLLQKGREVELLQKESGATEVVKGKLPKNEQNKTSNISDKTKSSRCSFCHYRGHTVDECRKRIIAKEKEKPQISKANESVAKPADSSLQNTIVCYGCGKAGYFRSNCPNIDTAAKTSVAGRSLYECFKQVPSVTFQQRKATVTLANGSKILTTTVDIEIGHRVFEIDFVILPTAEDNRTLLGIDFLEKAAMVLFFADKPVQRYEFIPLSQGRTPDLVYAASTLTDDNNVTHNSQEEVTRPNSPSMPLVDTNETPTLSMEVTQPSSLFLDIFTSPLPGEQRYTLYEIDIPPECPTPLHALEENNGNYSPNAIDQIFQDALPILPCTNSPRKRDPRKRRRLDLFSIDVVLKSDEAPELTDQQRNAFNHVLLQYQDRFDETGQPTAYSEHRIDTEDVTNVESNQKWIIRGYFLHKGVLYRYTDDQEDDDARLVVPSGEVKNILYAYHDSPTAGHYGIEKTTHRISSRIKSWHCCSGFKSNSNKAILSFKANHIL